MLRCVQPVRPPVSRKRRDAALAGFHMVCGREGSGLQVSAYHGDSVHGTMESETIYARAVKGDSNRPQSAVGRHHSAELTQARKFEMEWIPLNGISREES